MFAIIQTGGKQYKVAKGQTLEVEKLDKKEGEKISINNVLLLSNGDTTKIGTPLVEGAFVSAKVISQHKGEKIVIFKMKAKKRYQKKAGFRKSLTTIEILEINETGGKAGKIEEEKSEQAEPIKKPTIKAAKPKAATKKAPAKKKTTKEE